MYYFGTIKINVMYIAPVSANRNSLENGGLARMYSAKLIFRTIKNGMRKKISSQMYGTATINVCHSSAD